jgi:predicted metalloprotease
MKPSQHRKTLSLMILTAFAVASSFTLLPAATVVARAAATKNKGTILSSARRNRSQAETYLRSMRTTRSPDMPLAELIDVLVKDINQYWSDTFAAAGWKYTPPQRIVGYREEIKTPCGKAELGNAFYCPASNEIYYDYALLERFYKDPGDATVLIILAHEWGHAIQKQLGISKSNNFSIQVELQADCFCGAYAKNADERKILEESDLDEGIDGLLRLKDPKGTPWLDSNAHGKGYQRVRSFDDGLKGGPFACGFVGSLVGIWLAEVTEPGYPVRITWKVNPDGTYEAWFTTALGTSTNRGTWAYSNGLLTQTSLNGPAQGTLNWIDNKHIVITIIQNSDGPSARGRTRHYFRQ